MFDLEYLYSYKQTAVMPILYWVLVTRAKIIKQEQTQSRCKHRNSPTHQNSKKALLLCRSMLGPVADMISWSFTQMFDWSFWSWRWRRCTYATEQTQATNVSISHGLFVLTQPPVEDQSDKMIANTCGHVVLGEGRCIIIQTTYFL